MKKREEIAQKIQANKIYFESKWEVATKIPYCILNNSITDTEIPGKVSIIGLSSWIMEIGIESRDFLFQKQSFFFKIGWQGVILIILAGILLFPGMLDFLIRWKIPLSDLRYITGILLVIFGFLIYGDFEKLKKLQAFQNRRIDRENWMIQIGENKSISLSDIIALQLVEWYISDYNKGSSQVSIEHQLNIILKNSQRINLLPSQSVRFQSMENEAYQIAEFLGLEVWKPPFPEVFRSNGSSIDQQVYN